MREIQYNVRFDTCAESILISCISYEYFTQSIRNKVIALRFTAYECPICLSSQWMHVLTERKDTWQGPVGNWYFEMNEILLCLHFFS